MWPSQRSDSLHTCKCGQQTLSVGGFRLITGLTMSRCWLGSEPQEARSRLRRRKGAKAKEYAVTPRTQPFPKRMRLCSAAPQKLSGRKGGLLVFHDEERLAGQASSPSPIVRAITSLVIFGMVCSTEFDTTVRMLTSLK